MSRTFIPDRVRQRVAEAARFRCGYCLTSQRIIGPLLEIEHIVPESRGGTSEEWSTRRARRSIRAPASRRPSPARRMGGGCPAEIA